MTDLAKVRNAGLNYMPPMWKGADTRNVSDFRKVRTALEDEAVPPMWRKLDTVVDGRRYPATFVVPGERRMLPVSEAARRMGKSEEEVERLVELGFLHASREDDELKVEPAVLT